MRMQSVFFVIAVLGASAQVGAAEPTRRVTPRPAPTPSAPVREAPPPQAINNGVVSVLPQENCALATPDKVVSLTSSGIESFNTAPIGQPGCSAFVVDFQVDHAVAMIADPGYYSPDLVLGARDSVRETDMGNETYYAKVTQPVCATYKHTITVYRKKAGDAVFTEVGGGALKATWNAQGVGFGPVCMLTPGAGYHSIPRVVAPAQGAGTDTYRVALWVPGAPGQVLASALHPKK